ncbi:MAG: GAF domain-containing protein [Polyangiaceae bacterium]|nr:GAF domain-containing protein [Polyangiaceae bacterium]
MPFVVISGTIGEDLAVEAMTAGVHDYLIKGNLKHLGPAIRRELHDAQTRRERWWGVERLHHLNQVLRAIRSVNQLIVREKEPRRLVERACECLVESRGYRTAWIANLNERNGSSMSASAGMGEKFESMKLELQSGIQPKCCAEALSSGEVVIVADPETFCSGCPLSDCPCGRGSLTCRLDCDGTTYGVLSVNLDSGFVGDAEDASLVAEIAGDIGFALKSLETNDQLQEDRQRPRPSREERRFVTSPAISSTWRGRI